MEFQRTLQHLDTARKRKTITQCQTKNRRPLCYIGRSSEGVAGSVCLKGAQKGKRATKGRDKKKKRTLGKRYISSRKLTADLRRKTSTEEGNPRRTWFSGNGKGERGGLAREIAAKLPEQGRCPPYARSAVVKREMNEIIVEGTQRRRGSLDKLDPRKKILLRELTFSN